MNECQNVYQCQNDCGEAPLWLEDSGEIMFVDTGGEYCYGYLPRKDEKKKTGIEAPFQTIARAADGRFIVTFADKVAICGDKLKLIEKLEHPLSDKAYMMLNDGTVGPDGCFYFSIINAEDLNSKEGAVARMNKDLSMEIAAEGFALPNGLAFDPSGTAFYVTEMFANTIHRFDVKPGSAGGIELFGRRKIVRIPEEDGMPDGLITDGEGFLWSAHWQGFRITRYDPDGKIERTVPVPVPTPTSMAFGGEDMTTLFITTAKKGLSEKQLKEYPQSGDLFMVQTDIQGSPERVFSDAGG